MYAGQGRRYLDNQYQEDKKMIYIRTPPELWEEYKNEFNFTLDACASDKNHLCEKYYTKETDGLKQDWTGEVVWVHPMYDLYLPKWVEKCSKERCVSVLLIPASTHTKYFHDFIYNKPNVEVRFLRNPRKDGKSGWYMATDEGEYSTSVGYIRPLMIVIFRNV